MLCMQTFTKFLRLATLSCIWNWLMVVFYRFINLQEIKMIQDPTELAPTSHNVNPLEDKRKFESIVPLHAQSCSRVDRGRSPSTEASLTARRSLPSAVPSVRVNEDGEQPAALHHAIASSPSSELRTPLVSPCQRTQNPVLQPVVQHKCEMSLHEDIIGCIIGRGGNKISEIRQVSLQTGKIIMVYFLTPNVSHLVIHQFTVACKLYENRG